MSALPLFLLTIILPLVSIVMLWRRPRVPAGGWLATLFAAAGVTGFSVLFAPWGTLGLPVRYALIALFALAVLVSLRRAVPAERKEESPMRAIVKVLLGLVFGSVGLGVLRGHEVPPGAIDLAFPLRGGSFLIGHGGSTGPSNMYNANPQQRYALDILKLTPFGTRARGLFPSDPRAYAIFDAEVLSPCNGAVVSAAEDQVVVRCGTANVTLGPLRRGTVAVRPGAPVATGQLLGRVGQYVRRGFSPPEPHLHVFAERNGAAVPARFGGEWWVRNEVARR